MPTITRLLCTLLFLLFNYAWLAPPALAQQFSQLAMGVVPTPVNTDSAAFAADASRSTAAMLHPGLNKVAASERVSFSSLIPANTQNAGIRLAFTNVALSLLQAGVLPDVTIATYVDGTATGEQWTSSQLLTLSVLQSSQPTDVTLNPAPKKAFNQLELRAAGAVNAYTLNFYAAFGPAATPLPVQLLSFTAARQGSSAVRLAWATASERNSAYFEVERSLDGRTFTRLDQVAAAGTSLLAHAYSFEDASPGVGSLYYRLRQVNQDGTMDYSPVRTVGLAPGATALALYPVPARAQTTLTGVLPGAEVQLVSLRGQLVLRSTADATGTAHLDLPAGLASGVYLVRAGSRTCRLAVAP